MEIRDKLTNRVYHPHKVRLVVDDDILCEASLPQHEIEALLVYIEFIHSDYDELR